MELRLTARPMPSDTNRHRNHPSNTLHAPRRPRIRLMHPHLPRRMRRLTHPRLTRQRRVLFFPFPIHPHRTRHLLRILPTNRNVNSWHNHHLHAHSDGIHRLRPRMGPNEPMSSNSNHKPALGNPNRRKKNCRVSMRGLRSQRRNPTSLLCIPLPFSLHPRGPSRMPHCIPPHHRINKPTWDQQ